MGGDHHHSVPECTEGHHKDTGGGAGRSPPLCHVQNPKGQSDPGTEGPQSQSERGHPEGHELCPNQSRQSTGGRARPGIQSDQNLHR